MAEPKPEEIEMLVNMSALHPSEVIKLLKAHNNDLNAAAVAFLDSPNQYPPYPVVEAAWDESAFHSDKTDRHQPAFTVNPQDTLKPSVFASAPSRPPSRVSTRLGQPMSQSGVSISNPQEARDLDQALKMSMMSSDSHDQGQMTGVTNTSAPHFGPARQEEHYDKNWQMTVPGDYTKEIWLNPEPADRKRDGAKPAFLRPATHGHRLPALIKILQTIPMAREAMLCRDLILSDYGQHSEWWDGTPIHLPETFNEADDRSDYDGEELLYETQRLVAFLEKTERAYGSVDALLNASTTDSLKDEEIYTLFFKALEAASEQMGVKLALHHVVESVGVKKEPNEPVFIDDISFSTLQVRIDDEIADKGHTLYDVVDDILWANDGVQSDTQDIYLEKVADVFILDVKRLDEASSGLGIRIPAVWYLDRYLESSVDEMKRMRKSKAAILEELDLLERQRSTMAEYKPLGSAAGPIQGLALLKIAIKFFESVRAGAVVSDRQEEQVANAAEPNQVVQDLHLLCETISRKLQAIEHAKDIARAKLEEISKLYTKPAADPRDPPYHAWTLRGVCSDPKTVYVLEKTQPEVENDMLSTEAKDWQWWKITYIGSDSKPVSQSKVREIEVLKAAKDECNSAILVYASEKAMNYEVRDLPSELRNFVRLDNLNFTAELEKSGFSKPTTPKRKSDDAENEDPAPNYYGLSPLERNGEYISSSTSSSESNLPPPYFSHTSLPAFSEPDESRMPNTSTNAVNSHDEAIPGSLRSSPSTINPAMLLNQAGRQPAGQEMEDRGRMMGTMHARDDPRNHGYSFRCPTPDGLNLDDFDLSLNIPQTKYYEYA